MAKKSKKKIVRREYSKADVRELRAHSKARTPVDKIAKLTKRTVGSLRQKALKLGIRLSVSADDRGGSAHPMRSPQQRDRLHAVRIGLETGSTST